MPQEGVGKSLFLQGIGDLQNVTEVSADVRAGQRGQFAGRSLTFCAPFRAGLV